MASRDLDALAATSSLKVVMRVRSLETILLALSGAWSPTAGCASSGIAARHQSPPATVDGGDAAGGTPTAIDVAGTNVYVGTEAAGSPGAVASCPKADCSGGPKIIATGLSYCAGIAVDENSIYFTDRGATGDAGAVPGPSARSPVATPAPLP